MSTTSVINVNVDATYKKKATLILSDLGLNMTTAINMHLAQIVIKNGIPFTIDNPNPSPELIEALNEIPDMINNNDKYKRYNNWNDLKESLLDDKE